MTHMQEPGHNHVVNVKQFCYIFQYIFQSYFPGRTQCILIEVVLSKLKELVYGVPQGSVLGQFESTINHPSSATSAASYMVLFLSFWTLGSILKPLSVFYTYISIFVNTQVWCILCIMLVWSSQQIPAKANKLILSYRILTFTSQSLTW